MKLEINILCIALLCSLACPAGVSYEYDLLGRLTSASYSTGHAIYYEYDLSGNRTSYVGVAPGSTISEGHAMTHGGSPNLSITNAGEPGASYDWYRNGVKLGTTSAPSLELGGFTPQDAGGYRVIVREADGSVSIVELMVKLSGLTYESWLKHKEAPAATPADPGLGKMASASNDGVQNILKYAVGRGPHEAAHDVLPKAVWIGSGENQRLAVTYQRIMDPLDISIKVEASGDLVGWRDVSNQVTLVGQPIPATDGLTEKVTFQVPVTIIQAQAANWKFLRIAVANKN